MEQTLGQITCPHQTNALHQCLDAATHQPVPNAVLDPRDALAYSNNLGLIHAALKALPGMPPTGGQCVPALEGTLNTPALAAQSAPNPGACLVLISSLLTTLQTALEAIHG